MNIIIRRAGSPRPFSSRFDKANHKNRAPRVFMIRVGADGRVQMIEQRRDNLGNLVSEKS